MGEENKREPGKTGRSCKVRRSPTLFQGGAATRCWVEGPGARAGTERDRDTRVRHGHGLMLGSTLSTMATAARRDTCVSQSHDLVLWRAAALNGAPREVGREFGTRGARPGRDRTHARMPRRSACRLPTPPQDGELRSRARLADCAKDTQTCTEMRQRRVRRPATSSHGGDGRPCIRGPTPSTGGVQVPGCAVAEERKWRRWQQWRCAKGHASGCHARTPHDVVRASLAG